MDPNIVIDQVPFHQLADPQLAYYMHYVLHNSFPGYTWIVGLDEDDTGGVAYIMNLEVNEQILGLPNWGYTLKLSTVYNDPTLKCVRNAGGAILESAGISTGKNKDEVIKSIDGMDNTKHILIGPH